MPVVITITALLYLFRGGSSGPPSFFCPGALRKKLGKELPRGEVRERALAVIDRLDELSFRYSEIIEQGLEDYIELTQRSDGSAKEAEALLASLDITRDQVLLDVVGVREELRAQLSEEQWDGVFH